MISTSLLSYSSSFFFFSLSREGALLSSVLFLPLCMVQCFDLGLLSRFLLFSRFPPWFRIESITAFFSKRLDLSPSFRFFKPSTQTLTASSSYEKVKAQAMYSISTLLSPITPKFLRVSNNLPLLPLLVFLEV